jgi:hypothetical protein
VADAVEAYARKARPVVVCAAADILRAGEDAPTPGRATPAAVFAGSVLDLEDRGDVELQERARRVGVNVLVRALEIEEAAEAWTVWVLARGDDGDAARVLLLEDATARTWGETHLAKAAEALGARWSIADLAPSLWPLAARALRRAPSEAVRVEQLEAMLGDARLDASGFLELVRVCLSARAVDRDALDRLVLLPGVTDRLEAIARGSVAGPVGTGRVRGLMAVVALAYAHHRPGPAAADALFRVLASIPAVTREDLEFAGQISRWIGSS